MLIVFLLRDKGGQEIKNSLSSIFTPRVNDHKILLTKIFFLALVVIVLWFLCIILYLQVPGLCIANPANNTKFLTIEGVNFQGKAYGNIERVRLLEGNKFLDGASVNNNVWNLSHQFNNLGDKEITIQGINGANNVTTERQVTITIVDP